MAKKEKKQKHKQAKNKSKDKYSGHKLAEDDLSLWQHYTKKLSPIPKNKRRKLASQITAEDLITDVNQSKLSEAQNDSDTAQINSDTAQDDTTQDADEALEFEDLLNEFEKVTLGKKPHKTLKKSKKILKSTSPIQRPANPNSYNQPIPTPFTPQFPAQSPAPSPTHHLSRKEIERRNYQKLKKGLIKLDGVIDLHGHRANEAYKSLLNYVRAAQNRGFRYILVITGKGSSNKRGQEAAWYEEGDVGVLRRSFPGWVADEQFKPYIIGYSQAHKKDGGEGAFYVHLKRHR